MADKHTFNFPGIGESSFINDPELGPIPLINNDDTEEVKQKKDVYIKNKIDNLSKISGIDFET
jgi:hypothetical protein